MKQKIENIHAVFVCIQLLVLVLALSMMTNGQEKNVNEVQTVLFCDLVKNPQDYDQKIIRVTTVYRYGQYWSELYCPECEIKDRVSFEVSADFESKTKRKFRKKIKWSDLGRTVKITAVGKFYASGNYGHRGQLRYELVANYLESAEIILYDGPALLPDNLRDKWNCSTEKTEQ